MECHFKNMAQVKKFLKYKQKLNVYTLYSSTELRGKELEKQQEWTKIFICVYPFVKIRQP